MAGIIVALDVPSAGAAIDLVERLGTRVDFYKVGSPLFTRAGPAIVHELRSRGKRVFLDLKFHDIPNTVARAVESAAEMDVDLLTLHASGGTAMMRAAAAAAGAEGPRLLGVTVLTSLTQREVEESWGRSVDAIRDEVVRLAGQAAASGLHGIVASPMEAATLRAAVPAGFLIVTPGVRPAGAAIGDQARVATPGDAARAGADYLVIGRPVLDANDPVAVVESVHAEVHAALETPA